MRQKLVIKKIVENGGNISKSMREVGYSPMTAQDPKKLTSSKGFKELCEQYGLTDELILTSLVDDIKGKPKNRKPELELAAKIKRLVGNEEKENNVTVIIDGIEMINPEYENNSSANPKTIPSVGSSKGK